MQKMLSVLVLLDNM